VVAIWIPSWNLKQECDEDRSQTAVESEFQAAGLETAKLRDPYRDS